MKPVKKYIVMALYILSVVVYLGCNSGGRNNRLNTCFSIEQAEPEPCFDADAKGTTSVVIDKTVDEVIAEQEAMGGFIGELPFTEIIKEDFFSGPIPPELEDCLSVYVESELVVNSEEDWDLFRESCWFSQFDLADVDFSAQSVLSVIQGSIGVETDIVAVLEFSSKIVVIVSDQEFSELPPSVHAGPFHIVFISNTDIPFDFIRVKEVTE